MPKLKTPASFKPGQSGNPKGAPKKEWSLTESMRQYMSETDPETKKIRRDLFIESQMHYALKGDPTASKHVWQYIQGMPKGDNPLGDLPGKIVIEWGNNAVSDSNSTE